MNVETEAQIINFLQQKLSIDCDIKSSGGSYYGENHRLVVSIKIDDTVISTSECYLPDYNLM